MPNYFDDLFYAIRTFRGVYVLLNVLLIILGLFLVVLGYIFFCNTLKHIGRKVKVKDDWMAYVPFAQDVYRLKIARKPMWQLCFFGSCGFVLITLVNLLFALIGSSSLQTIPVASYISSILTFAWLLVRYYVNYMFCREFYEKFGFNPLLALIVFVPGMEIAMLILDIIIAYKNDIQWGSRPIIPPPDDPNRIIRTRADGRITALSGTYAGAVFSMRDNETVNLGRDPMKCQIVFDDKNIEVSHMHCSIRYSAMGNSYIVTDYSKNGTWRDDNTRLHSNMPNSLPAGTVIYLGSRKNTFRLG